MATSFNGIGTYWYGHADEGRDGSYVVTEWITFVYLPLLPLGSKRVLPLVEEDKPWWKKEVGANYNVMKVPLHWPLVFKGYAVLLAIVLFVWVADRKR